MKVPWHMKIQEMRSGITHLTRRLEASRRVELRTEEALEAAPVSDLDKPRWSVISFNRCETASLTYTEAAHLLSELFINGTAGLCIVTDEVGRRVTS